MDVEETQAIVNDSLRVILKRAQKNIVKNESHILLGDCLNVHVQNADNKCGQ